MLLKARALTEGEVALGALVGFLTRVCAHVRLEVAAVTASVVALAALVWLLPSVSTHVLLEITAGGASKVTIAALVRLLPSVSTHVSLQSMLPPAAVVALAASERPLLGVPSALLPAVALGAPPARCAGRPASPRRLAASLPRGLRTATPRRARRGHRRLRRPGGWGRSAACEQQRGQSARHGVAWQCETQRHWHARAQRAAKGHYSHWADCDLVREPSQPSVEAGDCGRGASAASDEPATNMQTLVVRLCFL